MATPLKTCDFPHGAPGQRSHGDRLCARRCAVPALHSSSAPCSSRVFRWAHTCMECKDKTGDGNDGSQHFSAGRSEGQNAARIRSRCSKNLATRVNCCRLSSGSCRGEFVVQLGRCHPRLRKPMLHLLLIASTAGCSGCCTAVGGVSDGSRLCSLDENMFTRFRRTKVPGTINLHSTLQYTFLLCIPMLNGPWYTRNSVRVNFLCFASTMRACRRAAVSFSPHTSMCMCWLSLSLALEDLSSYHQALQTSSRTVIPSHNFDIGLSPPTRASD